MRTYPRPDGALLAALCYVERSTPRGRGRTAGRGGTGTALPTHLASPPIGGAVPSPAAVARRCPVDGNPRPHDLRRTDPAAADGRRRRRRVGASRRRRLGGPRDGRRRARPGRRPAQPQQHPPRDHTQRTHAPHTQPIRTTPTTNLDAVELTPLPREPPDPPVLCSATPTPCGSPQRRGSHAPRRPAHPTVTCTQAGDHAHANRDDQYGHALAAGSPGRTTIAINPTIAISPTKHR